MHEDGNALIGVEQKNVRAEHGPDNACVSIDKATLFVNVESQADPHASSKHYPLNICRDPASLLQNSGGLGKLQLQSS